MGDSFVRHNITILSAQIVPQNQPCIYETGTQQIKELRFPLHFASKSLRCTSFELYLLLCLSVPSFTLCGIVCSVGWYIYKSSTWFASSTPWRRLTPSMSRGSKPVMVYPVPFIFQARIKYQMISIAKSRGYVYLSLVSISQNIPYNENKISNGIIVIVAVSGDYYIKSRRHTQQENVHISRGAWKWCSCSSVCAYPSCMAEKLHFTQNKVRDYWSMP